MKEHAKPKPLLLYAPDAIYKNGKYYLYFCCSDESEGVAVSDKPTGPFKNVKRLPCNGIDPAIFNDTDGKSYYYWGQCFSKGVMLNSNMTSFDRSKIKDPLITESEHYFHEGSSMRKIGDTYYLVYASIVRGKPTTLSYATSKSPLGPFKYRGEIIDNATCDPQSWNNHGSIECFKGQWYVFYHRSSHNSQNYRRLCIEPIKINEDGSIDEVLMTSQGPGPAFRVGEVVQGRQVCEVHDGCYVGESQSFGESLVNLQTGSSAIFRYFNFEDTPNQLNVSGSGSGKINVYQDSKLIGQISIVDGKAINNKLTANKNNKSKIELKVIEGNNLEINTFSFES